MRWLIRMGVSILYLFAVFFAIPSICVIHACDYLEGLL